jgi:hypothetical protein
MSVPLPAVNGTTNLMLCLGQSWACAFQLKAESARVANANFRMPFDKVFVRNGAVMLSPLVVFLN